MIGEFEDVLLNQNLSCPHDPERIVARTQHEDSLGFSSWNWLCSLLRYASRQNLVVVITVNKHLLPVLLWILHGDVITTDCSMLFHNVMYHVMWWFQIIFIKTQIVWKEDEWITLETWLRYVRLYWCCGTTYARRVRSTVNALCTNACPSSPYTLAIILSGWNANSKKNKGVIMMKAYRLTSMMGRCRYRYR
jgi:hypothetical protein